MSILQWLKNNLFITAALMKSLRLSMLSWWFNASVMENPTDFSELLKSKVENDIAPYFEF